MEMETEVGESGPSLLGGSPGPRADAGRGTGERCKSGHGSRPPRGPPCTAGGGTRFQSCAGPLVNTIKKKTHFLRARSLVCWCATETS